MKNLILALGLFLQYSLASLTFQVEPRTSDCFYLDLMPGQRVRIPFYVTRGGLLDIDLRINGPNNEQIYSGMQFESSQFEFISRFQGPHSICWNNEMSRWTAKVVQFHVEVDGRKIALEPGNPKQDEVLTPGALTPMEDSINKISTALDSIQSDQRYFRSREQRHRDTAESTNARVFWYSVIESILLIGISLGQVYYLRKFFEVKRTV